VTSGDSGVLHVIEIHQGSTYALDVRVVGSLPGGVGQLAFTVNNNREQIWDAKLSNLSNGAVIPRTCDVEIIHGSAIEPVQCSTVEYAYQWNRNNVFPGQNLPLQVNIQVK
jgi:hypothetical protein